MKLRCFHAFISISHSLSYSLALNTVWELSFLFVFYGCCFINEFDLIPLNREQLILLIHNYISHFYLPLQFGESQTLAVCFPLLPTTRTRQRGHFWHGEKWNRAWRRRQHIDSARWELEATPRPSLLISTGPKNLQSAQVRRIHKLSLVIYFIHFLC